MLLTVQLMLLKCMTSNIFFFKFVHHVCTQTLIITFK